MENKQEILRWFGEILFKLKLIEAQVNVMEELDMTSYGIAELKNIANNFITTGKNIKEEINNNNDGVL